MNRDLNFRVWVKKDKAMSPPATLVDLITTGVKYPEASLHFTRSLDSGESIVMQSTGLFDKNGKEVYEGDVIRTEYDNPDSDGTQICAVRWDDDLPGFTDDYHDGLHSNIEVIGNIYENPELLK